MPLSINHKIELTDYLISQGWKWEESNIMAPCRTMWLYKEPWMGSLEEFRNAMMGRLWGMIERHSDEKAINDTEILAKKLDSMCEDGGLELFFSKYANTLNEFSDKCKLTVNKYREGCPGWEFRFKHPTGGIGVITVTRIDQFQVEVSCRCLLDDFHSRIRLIKEYTLGNVVDIKMLDNMLCEALNRVLSWNKIDLQKIISLPMGEDVKVANSQYYNELHNPNTEPCNKENIHP